MLDRDLGEIKQFDTEGILRATRAGVVLDVLPISDGYDIIPESFRRGLYPHWGILRRQGKEIFLLTERDFTQGIDRFFWHLPSRLIEFYLSRSQADQVRILDIGGGRDATAAREIASRYPSAQVLNVDIVAINERRGNLTSIRGDICDLRLPDASIDVAYSHQLFPYMSRRDNFGRHIEAIHEIFRVLNPGGTGVIDFTDDSSWSGDALRGRDQKWDGRVLPKRKSCGGVFLLVAKNPVDTAVIKIGETAPDLAV